jgi:hypothetical protein
MSGFFNVLGGADRGKKFDLNRPENRIGRGADQDIVLSDIAVSRRHITVSQEGLQYKLTDLGSGNGTLVNGQRISVHYLKDGDVVEIGQTVMRFDHPGSQQPAAPPQPAYQPPPQRQVPPAPSAAVQMPPGGPMAFDTPSDAIEAPPARPMTYQPQQGPQLSRNGRIIAFSVMGALCAGSITIILMKTAFAKPVVVAGEAEDLFKQGVRLFASHDFEGAKAAFTDSQAQASDSADVKRYVEACDTEIKAKQLFKSAERAVSNKRWTEAMKALDQIDPDSILFDQVARMRRDHGPRAAREEVAEAQQLANDDPSAARAKAEHALKLDPMNEDARALVAKLGGASAVAAAPKVKEEPAPPPEKPAPAEKPAAVASAKPDKHHHTKDDGPVGLIKIGGGDSAPSKPAKEEPVAAPVASGNALALYKSKDFDGAMKAYRLEGMKYVGAKSQQFIDTANQVKQLKTSLDKAAGEESSAPQAAVKDYEECLALDSKISKGVHAGFIKQKIGKAQVAVASSSFSAGKYESAFASAQVAQKYGADAGSILKQLESKASELTSKGEGMKKSNLAGAKALWRQVIKMVPSSSPSYIKAYGLINSAGANRKDEDED